MCSSMTLKTRQTFNYVSRLRLKTKLVVYSFERLSKKQKTKNPTHTGLLIKNVHMCLITDMSEMLNKDLALITIH